VNASRPVSAERPASTHLLRTVNLARAVTDLWKPSSDEIILHPGSGSPKKNWPHFDQLALALREREANSQVKLGIPEGLTLVEVSHRLRHSRAYIRQRFRDHPPGRFPGRACRRPFRSHRSPDLGTHGAPLQGHLEENSEDISVDEVLLRMERTPEPEFMNEQDQAAAYAAADWSESHGKFQELSRAVSHFAIDICSISDAVRQT